MKLFVKFVCYYFAKKKRKNIFTQSICVDKTCKLIVKTHHTMYKI